MILAEETLYTLKNIIILYEFKELIIMCHYSVSIFYGKSDFLK